MTIYTFHVTDAVTGLPIEGAACSISDVALRAARLEGEGGITDEYGVCAIDILYFPPNYYGVYKAGYVTAKGSVPGTQINVQLQPTAGPVKYYVNINATGPATLNPAAGLYQVDANSTLLVTVTSIEAGYFLSRWRVDDVDVPAQGNSISVKITHDSFTIYAVIESKYTVYVSPVAGVGGTTDPFGGFLVLPNAQITARAIPDSGYVLDHWIINGVPSGSANPITVTVSKDQFMVEAVFKLQGQPPPLQYTLSVTISGGGTVTLNPLGGTYEPNTTVTLTANPPSGGTFTGWSGALSGTTNPTTLVMNSNKTVIASFAGGSGTKTDTVNILTDYKLTIPLNWQGNHVDKNVEYKWDPAKTTINKITFKARASSNTGNRRLNFYANGEIMGFVGWTDNPDTWQEIAVDVTNLIKSGSTTYKFDYVVTYGAVLLADAWIYADLIVDYSGDEPTVVIPQEPFDWEKYLPYVLVGGGIIVAVLLLSGRGGGITLITTGGSKTEK